MVSIVKEDSTESQSEPKYSDSSQSGGWQNLPKRANITVPNHSTPKPTSTCCPAPRRTLKKGSIDRRSLARNNGRTFPGQKISTQSWQRRRSGLAHEEGLDVPERLQRKQHPSPQPDRRAGRQHRPQQRRQPPAACAAVLQEERVAEEVGEGERDEPEAPRPARAQSGGGRLER